MFVQEVFFSTCLKKTQTLKYCSLQVIQSPETKSSLAVIQVNSPDLKITDANRYMICKDIYCRNVEWMSGTNWVDPANGYTFCCTLPDFERAFGYSGLFGTGNNNVLRDVYGWSGGRSY